MFYFWSALSGLFSGILGGLGMGGGTLLIPILTIFLGYSQIESQGINLLAFIPMSLVALIIHAKNKLIDYKTSVPIIISGVIFSVFGAFVANSINTLSLRKLFGIFLVFLGLFQGASFFIFDTSKNKKSENFESKNLESKNSNDKTTNKSNNKNFKDNKKIKPNKKQTKNRKIN